jgi:hypothetical protein
VAHLQAACIKQGLDLRAQFQQAQQVGDRGAGLADRLGHLLMREAEFLLQPLQCAGLLQRRQVLALDVLDQRDGEAVCSSTSRTTTGMSASPACWQARQRRSPAMIS